MQFGKTHFLDSILHTTSSSSSSSLTTQELLLDQLLELEKKKFSLQKQKGQIDVNILKQRIHQLEGEVQKLQPSSTNNLQPVTPNAVPPITPLTTQTPAFLHTVSSKKEGLTPPLPPSYSRNKPSSSTLPPHSSLKQEALAALLAEKENESFSDDDQEDNDEDISLTSANLDRRASRELTPPNLNRLSISRNNDLVDVFHPKPSHHPLSNRLNYNNLGRPPSVGATGRPPSTGYTPPRFNTNIRTISANDGDRGRESLGSVEERTSLSNFYPPLDEKLTRIDNSDFIQDKAVLAGVRAHLNTEDLETDYLETNDGIADLSPPNTLSACQNLLEFCIIEADWQELLKQSLSHALKDTTAPDLSQPHMLTRPKYLSNLIPPKLIWRYPSTVDEQTNNTSTVQDQNFFFPSGVKVELVSRSVMEIKTRYYNYKRHIIPFSDRQGLPLYACCLTVNQSYNLTDIAKINDDLPFYLYRISKAKTAVKVIQKSFRYYLKRKRIKQWQTIDIADIKKLQQERQFFMNINGSSNSESMNGTSSQIGAASRFSFTGGGGTHQGSQGTPRSSSHRGSATANSATAPSGGGFFSRIFRRQSGGGIEERASRDSLDESSHHHNSTLFGFNRQTNKSETGNWTSSSHGKLGVEPLSTPSKGSTASTSASTTTATSVNPPSTNAPQRTSSLSFFSRSLTGSVSKMGTVPPTEVKADSRSKSNESNSEVTLVTESADLETSKQSITSLPEAKTEEVKSSPVEEEEVKKEDITPEHVQEVQEEKKEEAVNHEQLLMDEYHKFLEDKVVIGQKAYCVISSSPEYTFIFLLLDSIHQAESDFFQQREIHRKNLGNEGNNNIEEEEKGGKGIINEDEHEILRGKFLNKTKNFIEKYLINKQFQIEDLSNHFTIPKNYYQYKMNYYPPLQSIEHQKRYEFYHQLMFPHRYIPTNNTTQQALEEEMNSNYFDSVVNSPKFSPKPSFNTPTASSSSLSRLGRRTFSSQLMKGEGSVSMIDLNKEQEEAGVEVVKSDRDDIIAGIVQESKDDSDGKSEEVSGKSTDDVQPDEGGSPKKKRPTSLTITDDTLTTSASSSPFRSSMLANGRKTSSRRLLAEFASPLKVPSSLGSPTTSYTQCLRVRGYGRPLKIDFRYLLSTKEWSCAVLLTHLNAQVIFKIINLLLMEKSLIIYGKNPGIVSAITLGVMNLISPFIWEGIFIPLVPDIARELFGAPVPLIIGTISPPRLSDISPATAILHLNDDCVQGKLVFSLSPNHHQNNPTTQSPGGGGSLVRGVKIPSMSQKRKSVNPSSTSTVSSPASTTNTATEMLKDHHVTVSIEEVDFLAWFTRLPEVSIDMPIQEELSKRITHLRKLLCQNLLPHIHYVYDILLYDPKTLFEEIDQSTLANKQKPSSDESYYLKTMEKTISIKNTIDHLILNNNHLPLKILEEITVLLIRIKNYNYQFIGEILQLTSYDFNRFLKKNDKTNQEEFYPNLFLEPIRNRLEFQEGIIHTQMFLSFLDRIRKESMMLNQIREFIGHWIYQQHIRRKKRKNL